jgi:hypothetical protein
MTVNMNSHSRGALRPRFASNARPSKERAQGMPDARCTRGLVCNVHKKMRTRAYRAAEAIRHSLRNGFTAYAALSPETNSSCLRRQRIKGFVRARLGSKNLRRLDTSNGCQDHTVLPYASTSLVLRALITHGNPPCDLSSPRNAAASTATRPNVRDDGQRPSSRDGMAIDVN